MKQIKIRTTTILARTLGVVCLTGDVMGVGVAGVAGLDGDGDGVAMVGAIVVTAVCAAT